VEIKITYEDGTTSEFTMGEEGRLTMFWEKLTAGYPSVALNGQDRIFLCGNKLTIAEEYYDSNVFSTFVKPEGE